MTSTGVGIGVGSSGLTDLAGTPSFCRARRQASLSRIDQRVSIVKTIGIFEYITDDEIGGIAQSLRRVMPAGSAIVFNSISLRHGTDRFFRRVFGLHMIHRSPRQIQELLDPAGFGRFDIFPEPLGVYHVVVGRMEGKNLGESPRKPS